VRWLFPGKTVRVDAPYLVCGQPISIEMRDENVLSTSPAEGIVGYSYSEIGGPTDTRHYR
jgi:hypothetical protein